MEGTRAGARGGTSGPGPSRARRQCGCHRPWIHRPLSHSLSLSRSPFLPLGLCLYLCLASSLTGPQGAAALSLRHLLHGAKAALRRASTIGTRTTTTTTTASSIFLSSPSDSTGAATQAAMNQQQQQPRLSGPNLPYPRGVHRMQTGGGRDLGSFHSDHLSNVLAVDYEEAPKQYSTPDGLIAWPGLWGGTAAKMSFHGGRVLTDNITVYIIFYGSWPPTSGQGILENFILSFTEPDENEPVGVRLSFQGIL